MKKIKKYFVNFPDSNPYDVLRAVIKKRTGKSAITMLRELFNNIGFGNKTPSQLLRRLKTYLNQNIGGNRHPNIGADEEQYAHRKIRSPPNYFAASSSLDFCSVYFYARHIHTQIPTTN